MSLRPSAATLWLPISTPRPAWGAALVSVALYVATMGRGVGFFDGGELAVAAVQLGISHAPGQPFYTLVGWLFSHLPAVPPLWGLNALSALCGGLAVLPAFSLLERMLEPKDGMSPGLRAFALSTLVLVSQHVALWEQSTRVEVYALATLLALWCLARLAHLIETNPPWPSWLAVGFVLGLCAATNPVMALFTALAGAPGYLTTFARRELGGASLVCVVLGGVLGLAPYAYVPFVAGDATRLVWGAPTDAASFYAFVTARDYQVNLDVPLSQWASQAIAWLVFSSQSGLLPLWVVGLTGHVLAPPRALGRAAAVIASVLVVAYVSHSAVFRPELPDLVSYAAIATWLCAAGCAALVGTLWARGTRLAAAVLFATLALAVAFAPPSPFVRTRHVGDPAGELARTLLASLPKRTLVIAASDHWVAPLWYVQEIERQRPDVVVIATGLLSSSWYFEHLFARHPDLARFALRGPGGRMGRLARLVQANADRPVAFENEDDARALGIQTCPGPVLAHARSTCADTPQARETLTRVMTKLSDATGDGEPTVRGVLCSLGVTRARILVASGHAVEALEALLAPVGAAVAEIAPDTRERVSKLSRGQLMEPRWQRATPLGDPSHNLFLAAQIALAAGDLEHAVVWMLLARDLGLAEASDWLDHAAPKSQR